MKNREVIVWRRNGGQGGYVSHLIEQDDNFPASETSTIEINSETDAVPNSVCAAAMWLYLNRSALVGPAIPVLKERFGLRNLEAIEATKRAHTLAYPGA